MSPLSCGDVLRVLETFEELCPEWWTVLKTRWLPGLFVWMDGWTDGRMQEDASEREEVGISNAAAMMLRSLYIISLFVRPRANGATEKRWDGKKQANRR